MRASNFVLHAATAAAATALLASCGAAQAPFGPAPENVMAQRARPNATYKILYNFGRTGGRHPAAGVISDGTTLLGTTSIGGSGTCYNGCGTVYAMTTTGTRTTIHRFVSGTSDGHYPYSALTYASGTFYGTTSAGGSGTSCGDDGCGTVFSITTSGKEAVIHNFAGGSSDGSKPNVALVNVNGTLYGSTPSGGKYGQGTIFSISSSGDETVLHSFAGGQKDGAIPSSPLVDINGTLYGATSSGGADDHGTVFSITPTGAETVLHGFAGGKSDGSAPTSLIDVDGALFGATVAGGSGKRCRSGCGIFFEMSTTGSESVLHNFSGNEGVGSKSLAMARGAFYGTARYGGMEQRGTLFKISPQGTLTVLYSFGIGGKLPVAPLLIVKRTLYGVAQNGGPSNKGVVYTLTL